MTTVTIIGDTGGFDSVLQNCLAAAGIRDGKIPSDHVIIQVGDFVRCRASFRDGNRASVEIVHDLVTSHPGQWIQLLGNHEAAALGGDCPDSFDVAAALDDDAARLLHSMWENGSISLAAAISDAFGSDILVSHAGLTVGSWRRDGAPTSAADAADIVNRDRGKPLKVISRTGRLVGALNTSADTCWAEVNDEFYTPWLDEPVVPFAQIHGHASPWDWVRDFWWPETPVRIRAMTEVNHDTRRTMTVNPANGFVAESVDWRLGDLAAPKKIWPLKTLTGVEVSL